MSINGLGCILTIPLWLWELGPFSWTPGLFPIGCRCAAVALVSLKHARINSSNPSPKAAQDCPQARTQKRETATSECYVQFSLLF